MIELIIAFLLSIGQLDESHINTVEISDFGGGCFGVVNVDDVGSKLTVRYDNDKKTFTLQ